MSRMENMIELVKNYLEEKKWKYEYKEENHVIITGVKLDCNLQSAKILIRFNENGYLTVAVPPLGAKEEYRPAIAEYITRANYGMTNGNFEMDYNDGEIRFKVYTNYKGLDEISEDIIEESFVTPILMYERYGDGLAALLLGFSDPEIEIGKVENW